MNTLPIRELREIIYPELCEIGFENCYSCGNLCEENDDFCCIKKRTLTEEEMEKGCREWDTQGICPPGYMWI